MTTHLAGIRAIGFDLDGTLFDHLGSAIEGVNAFIRLLGAEPSASARRLWFRAEEEHFEQWRAGHITFQEQRRRRLQAVLPAVGITVPDSAEELDVLFEQYLRAYQNAWQPFPDAARTLVALKRDGLRLGILTNGNHEQQLAKLRVTGLDALVDVVGTSEQIGAPKPEPAAFHALARELGVTPAECVFVGDNPEHDIAGASAAGMTGVLINRYEPNPEDLATSLKRALCPTGS